MSASALLKAFAAEGGGVAINGDKLTLTGPAEVRQRHRADLVRLKPDILALLSAPTRAAPPAPTTRPRPTWQQELATPECQAILDTFWDRPTPALSAYIP